MRAQNITPGRIGTVLFFPKESFQLLEGKRKGWASTTSFGRNPHLQPLHPHYAGLGQELEDLRQEAEMHTEREVD